MKRSNVRLPSIAAAISMLLCALFVPVQSRAQGADDFAMKAKSFADLRLMLNTQRANPALAENLWLYLDRYPVAVNHIADALVPLKLPVRLNEMIGFLLADVHWNYRQAGNSAGEAAVLAQIKRLPPEWQKAFRELSDALRAAP